MSNSTASRVNRASRETTAQRCLSQRGHHVDGSGLKARGGSDHSQAYTGSGKKDVKNGRHQRISAARADGAVARLKGCQCTVEQVAI